MNKLLTESRALRVRNGETLVLKPNERMTPDQTESLLRCIDRAKLDCKVVVLGDGVDVAAVAE